jgi:hypothetical protein
MDCVLCKVRTRIVLAICLLLKFKSDLPISRTIGKEVISIYHNNIVHVIISIKFSLLMLYLYTLQLKIGNSIIRRCTPRAQTWAHLGHILGKKHISGTSQAKPPGAHLEHILGTPRAEPPRALLGHISGFCLRCARGVHRRITELPKNTRIAVSQ